MTRCPKCGQSGTNDPSRGGNVACYHCTCGFIECDYLDDDYKGIEPHGNVLKNNRADTDNIREMSNDYAIGHRMETTR